jgi:tocopherol cyclase
MRNLALIFSLSFLLTGIDSTLLSAQELKNGVQFSSHERLPGYGAKKRKHPEMFQGNIKRKQYFEGWYFKMVSEDGSSILSVIPGISLSASGLDQHAFIQVIDGKTAQTSYYSFPIEEFFFSREEFAIRIGNNYFSSKKIILDLKDENSILQGEVHFANRVELPNRKMLNPGIMGWYRFVPFMQCYHGVVSLNHDLEGGLLVNNNAINFNKGKGYIEKDWGSSMPSAWIWMQSNNFTDKSASFMLSVATIPWLGGTFTGFLGFFSQDSTIFRFATYTHARLKILNHGTDSLSIHIRDKKYSYNIEAIRSNSGLLKAPVNGSMDRRIPESIDARLKLSIMDHQGNLLFSDSTSIAGLEMVGDLMKLVSEAK